MPKPTIAAIPGPAAGAGLSLALACDLRYAVPGAILTTAFAKVAFAGDYGGTWFLTRLVGSSKAKELYYFSERLSAEDAERLGIVNAIFPAADFETEVIDRARKLAQGPSIAYRYMKENLNRAVAGELRRLHGPGGDPPRAHRAHRGPPRSRPRLHRKTRTPLPRPVSPSPPPHRSNPHVSAGPSSLRALGTDRIALCQQARVHPRLGHPVRPYWPGPRRAAGLTGHPAANLPVPIRNTSVIFP